MLIVAVAWVFPAGVVKLTHMQERDLRLPESYRAHQERPHEVCQCSGIVGQYPGTPQGLGRRGTVATRDATPPDNAHVRRRKRKGQQFPFMIRVKLPRVESRKEATRVNKSRS